jgi:hypothetical protein
VNATKQTPNFGSIVSQGHQRQVSCVGTRLTHPWIKVDNQAVCPASALCAFSRPDVALAIVLVIIITQSAFLAMAGVLRPWLSRFLNFLEVTCGLLDVATLIIIAVAYRAKMVSTVEQMVGTSQVRLATTMQM